MTRNILQRSIHLALHPTQAVAALQRRVRHRALSKGLLMTLFDHPGEYERLRQELLHSGLEDQIREKMHAVGKIQGATTGGKAYDLGTMSNDEAATLYAIVRKTKPKIIVETGVCNGYSSAVILQALKSNGEGMLHSIDFPEIAGMTYSAGTFWVGKGGAVVPSDKQSGWLIPDSLRDRWDLTLGKSQEVLPGLIDKLPELDIFIHDSEHSYECMMFEYDTAYPRLKPGGLLISDDISWNSSFFDFSGRHNLRPGLIAGNMGFVIKN
jgi:predicted O-methyltransferase YrrM